MHLRYAETYLLFIFEELFEGMYVSIQKKPALKSNTKCI